MEFKSKGVNKDEIFCCSKKDVKDVFGECDISVYFGITREAKIKCQGKIIAVLSIFNSDFISRDSLVLYPLKSSNFNNDLQHNFLKLILPKLYHIYQINKDNKNAIIKKSRSFYVEQYNNTLEICEEKL